MSWRDLSTLRRPLPASLAGLACALALLILAGSASAAPSPWWRLSSRPGPTYLTPEAKNVKIFAAATNLGGIGGNLGGIRGPNLGGVGGRGVGGNLGRAGQGGKRTR